MQNIVNKFSYLSALASPKISEIQYITSAWKKDPISTQSTTQQTHGKKKKKKKWHVQMQTHACQYPHLLLKRKFKFPICNSLFMGKPLFSPCVQWRKTFSQIWNKQNCNLFMAKEPILSNSIIVYLQKPTGVSESVTLFERHGNGSRSNAYRNNPIIVYTTKVENLLTHINLWEAIRYLDKSIPIAAILQIQLEYILCISKEEKRISQVIKRRQSSI